MKSPQKTQKRSNQPANSETISNLVNIPASSSCTFMVESKDAPKPVAIAERVRQIRAFVALLEQSVSQIDESISGPGSSIVRPSEDIGPIDMALEDISSRLDHIVGYTNRIDQKFGK